MHFKILLTLLKRFNYLFNYYNTKSRTDYVRCIMDKEEEIDELNQR